MAFDLFGLFRKKPPDPADERLRAEVRSELERLRDAFDDRLSESGRIAVRETIADDDLDHALEVMAEYLASDRQPVTADERASLQLLSHKLDRVEFVDSCLQDLPHRPDPA